ncbi:hypothetical protein H6F42_16230 [Pseudanabaena sp. FACHB-1998]|uniref:hypothetical protein n=1 Tax=Pseudanabaena sp. FACHB-1998 TaxID=2692858 RepID=UPI0016803BC0|nr:hypothetical protein [Pseudanabaena sp. FACHB-1998]MBD2178467.1 hypothetical protein [Pseudanabaena sp. FACHB-1998]
MSAIHHLPQRPSPLESSTSSRSPHLAVRPSIADRLSQLLHEIEAFLLACTYEEMCNFWKAIANLRQSLKNSSCPSEVPQFLTDRRKHRDFCRILEVLADLPYPKLHLSSQLSSQFSDRHRFQKAHSYSAFGYHSSASFKASLN